MQVSDEMVEKAAREMFDGAVGLGRWDDKFYAEERAGCLDGARRCLTAALAGHIVVTREPTVEQMEAAGKSVSEYVAKMEAAGGNVDATDYALWAVIYRAMIDAAPQFSRGE